MLTTSQAAAELGVSDKYIRSVIASGALDAVDIGTGGSRPTYRVSTSALAAFVDQLGVRTREDLAARLETRER